VYGHLGKIDEAALWELLLFLSIFSLLGRTLIPEIHLNEEIPMANSLLASEKNC